MNATSEVPIKIPYEAYSAALSVDVSVPICYSGYYEKQKTALPTVPLIRPSRVQRVVAV